MQKTDTLYNWTKWLLFINTFMAEAVLRHRAYADKSIDLQVILKLGIWVFTFAFCIYFYRIWARKLLQIDNIVLGTLLLLIVISCLYAPNPIYSIASAFSLIAVVFMLLMASVILTNEELLRQIILGCSTVVATSIMVYFINPEFGQMKEWVGNTLVFNGRLTGITGTANACGYIAAMALLGLYYYRQYLPRLTATYISLLLLNLIGLFMSDSRTSLFAMVIALLAASLITASYTRLAAISITACVLILTAAVIDYDMLFGIISRSGNIHEITSGTGRTAIWTAVIGLIAERPLFGWGYAASNTLIPEATPDIGFVANHAHNAFLQIALSVGYVGLLLFIVVIGLKIYYSFRSRVQLNIAFIFFLLIDGLTEPIAFQGPATTTTLVLATVLALNYRPRNETDYTAYQQRLPGSLAAG